MSTYILIDYIEVCETVGAIPSWYGLKKYKAKYWRS